MSDFEDIFDASEEDGVMGEEGIRIHGPITRLEERHIVGDVPEERGAWDMLRDFGMGVIDPAARARSTEDIRSYLDPATPHGTAGIDHALQVPTLGLADEIRGFTRAAMAADERDDLLAGLQGDRASYERFQDDYRRERDAARSELAEGGRERPGLSALGTATGMVASAPLTPSLGLGAGGGTATRIAGAMGEGALYGGASGFGASEADSLEGLLEDTGRGAVAGAVVSGAIRGGGEALSAANAAAPAARVAADRQRIASVGGPGPALTDRAVRELAGANPTPERLAEVAERLRRLRITSAAASPEDIYRAANAATDTLDASRNGMIDDILRASPDGEGRIPVADVTGSLDDLAGSLESRASDRSYAPLARRRASDFAETYATLPDGTIDLDATIPYRDLGEEITAYGGRTNWLDPELGDVRPPVEVARRMHGALRDVQDNYAESLLGPELGDSLRNTRADMRVSIGAGEMADRAVSRGARRSMLGLGDLSAANAAAASGASLPGVGLAMAARRGVEGRWPSIRATGLEAVAGLLDRAPERLGPWAGALRRMVARGVGIEAAHASLMDTDEEYRSMVEGLEEDGAGQPVTPEDFADFWESADIDDAEEEATP